MNENSLKARFQKLKQTLAPMSWAERWEYLFTYYKWVLWVLIGIIVLGSIIGSSIKNATTEVLLSGVTVNITLNEEVADYLGDDYFAHIGGREGKQIIELSQLQLDEKTPDTLYTTVAKISGMAAIERLDYLLLDTTALEHFLDQSLYVDLRQILSPEDLAQWEDALVYNTVEGEQVPVAIDLAGTDFAQRYYGENVTCYLAFVATSPRKEACQAFWTYLEVGP